MARQYYKDSTTGQMKPIGVKVEDTLPVGTIVEYNGQNIPEGWKDIGNGKIEKEYQVIPTNAKLENGDSTSATNGYTADYINDHSVVVSATEPSGSARKKVWKQHYYNLFVDYEKISNCNIESNGTLSNVNDYDVYYIPCEPSTTYLIECGNTVTNSIVVTSFQNEPAMGSTGNTRTVGTSIIIYTTRANDHYLAIRDTTNMDNINAGLSIRENKADKEYILNNNVYEEFKPQNEIVLWENSNPTSNFAGQTINLKTDNYSYYEIIWRLVKNSNQYKNTGKTTKSTYAYLDYVGGAGTLLGFKRDITAVTDTSITFADAYRINTNEVENGRCIPVKVIGYK